MLKKISAALLCIILVFAAAGCGKNSDSTGKMCLYEIDAQFDDENMRVTAQMGFSYCNYTNNEITELKFNLYGNAYREGAKIAPVSGAFYPKAYPFGESYGGMSILSVKENGESVQYEIAGADENILTVTLKNGLFPNEKTKIYIEYELDLAKNLHRTGYNDRTVNLGNWFPILCVLTSEGFYECEYYSSGDPFFSECANYNVNFKVKKSYTVAATGETVGVADEGEYNTYSMSVSGVRDFALVLSKDFKVDCVEVGGTKVYYYYYGEEVSDKAMDAAKNSLEFFNAKYGTYPYKTLSVVKTGFCYGGMEYPALTMISDALAEEDYLKTIVHENAHQWWYGLVGNNQTEHSWMDEGLAEFSTMLFFESYPDYGVEGKEMKESALSSYKAYYNVHKQLLGDVDTSMDRRTNEYLSDYEYQNIAYNKGLLLFDSLRKSIGEKRFYSGMAKYFDGYKYRLAAPENLIGCFERIGADTNGYFGAWIDGSVLL